MFFTFFYCLVIIRFLYNNSVDQTSSMYDSLKTSMLFTLLAGVCVSMNRGFFYSDKYSSWESLELSENVFLIYLGGVV